MDSFGRFNFLAGAFSFSVLINRRPTHHLVSACPGVYYIGTKGNKISPRFLTEYIAVTEDSPAISSEARAYGVQLPIIPRVIKTESLICILSAFHGKAHTRAAGTAPNTEDLHGVPFVQGGCGALRDP